MTPKRILVVDDEPLVCQSVKMLLAQDGHDNETANGGLEALDKFQSGEFDLAFLDYAMPGISGEELAHVIKGRHPAVATVMLAGYAPELPLAGIDFLVLKPPSFEDLREAITAVGYKAS